MHQATKNHLSLDSKRSMKKNAARLLSSFTRGFHSSVRTFSERDASLTFILLLILVLIHFQNRIMMVISTTKDTHVFSRALERTQPGGWPKGASPTQERRAPPPYLPLAQHLKFLESNPRRTSLQDMDYGPHRSSKTDLKETGTSDLKDCSTCGANENRASLSNIHSRKYKDLARLLVKLISFHNIKSMITFPCATETLWIFTFVEAMKVSYPITYLFSFWLLLTFSELNCTSP